MLLFFFSVFVSVLVIGMRLDSGSSDACFNLGFCLDEYCTFAIKVDSQSREMHSITLSRAEYDTSHMSHTYTHVQVNWELLVD